MSEPVDDTPRPGDPEQDRTDAQRPIMILAFEGWNDTLRQTSSPLRIRW
ncbi:hypothetical protein [Amycolatopsis orientalis]|nr:hypothetical protein [Amycolatopsis orientalis]